MWYNSDGTSALEGRWSLW